MEAFYADEEFDEPTKTSNLSESEDEQSSRFNPYSDVENSVYGSPSGRWSYQVCHLLCYLQNCHIFCVAIENQHGVTPSLINSLKFMT